MRPLPFLLLALAAGLGACQLDSPDAPAPDPAVPTSTVSDASTTGGDLLPSAEDIEREWRSGRWRAAARVDTAGRAAAEAGNAETADGIDRIAADSSAWRADLHLPLGGNVEGPSVLKAQVLLDRAGFSPGSIDGRWGDNTEKAISWFQSASDLKATGIIDQATLDALAERAGEPRALVVTRVLTADDVEGPFETLPSDVYEKAKLDRLGLRVARRRSSASGSTPRPTCSGVSTRASRSTASPPATASASRRPARPAARARRPGPSPGS